jgi:methyl-accepting chemotaxis protein
MRVLDAIVKELSRLTNKDELTASEAHQLLVEANDMRALIEKSVEEKFTANVEQLRAAFLQLNEKCENYESQIAHVESMIAESEAAVESKLSERIENLKASLSEVAKSVATLSARLGSSAADVNDTAEPIAEAARKSAGGPNVIKMPEIHSFTRQTRN